MIKRNLWLGGTLVTLFIAAVFAWMTPNREVFAFADGLPDQGRLIDTSEVAFFIVEKGAPDVPRVLHAHGTVAWSHIWTETQQNIAPEGYLVTAFDMPPFGWSEYPKTPTYGRQVQAARMIGLLEALAGKPILVAHLVEAGPATEAIMIRPNLVSGYIIVSGALGLADWRAPKDVPIPLQKLQRPETRDSGHSDEPTFDRTRLEKLHVPDRQDRSRNGGVPANPDVASWPHPSCFRLDPSVVQNASRKFQHGSLRMARS